MSTAAKLAACILWISGLTVAVHAETGSGESFPIQPKLVNAKTSRAQRSQPLGTSGPASADTVYVGYTPGHSSDNWWSIWSGSATRHLDGVWHRPPARGGMWDWEPPYGDVHGDSLQGWIPYRFEMLGTGGLTIDDWNRPWRALDYGNNANHVVPGATRTHGVVGVWHVDGGNTVARPASLNHTADPVAGVGGVNWAPLHDDPGVAGVGSAWMGLRRHGDHSHVDAVARGGTGNPFNEDVLVYNGIGSFAAGGTDKRFPGYGLQMDQMLYRDIDMTGATNLTVSFRYRTAMSTNFSTNSITRTGWFQFDPLTVITGGPRPNYFASSGNPTPPVDSFMVYIGAPAESVVTLSDGASHAIYDPKRRWFGEVIRGNEGLYRQILSVGGTVAATVFSQTHSVAAFRDSAAAGVSGVVRLVFRVKTNQFFDDESVISAGYSSGGVGAAIVDDVVVQRDAGPPITLGHFDDPAQIDHRVHAGEGGYVHYGNRSHPSHPLNAWKSTGKPPQAYHHVHPMAGDAGRGYVPLLYQDICGQVGDPARLCDLQGVVISAGVHDNAEASSPAGSFGTADQEPFDGMISPTMNLTGQGYAMRTIGGVPTAVNNMGLSADDADPTDDYYIDYEMYAGRMDLFNTGNAWRGFMQTFPAGNTATGTGEYKRWGMARGYPFTVFNPDKQCFRVQFGLKGLGMLRTTNASGIPDSVRLMLHYRQEAYRFGIPQSEWFDGLYWDNLGLAIVDGGAQEPISVDIWHFLHDTFPFNENAGLVGVASAFDTTAALIRSGINIAPTTGNPNRFDVPGDTTVVNAAGAAVRVDMLFRILPGPGNYVNPNAAPLSQVLKQVPTSPTPVAGAVANSTNFWENYMHDRGARGASTHPAPRWSPHVWNSARMDTAQLNLFQLHKRGIVTPADAGLFMSTYHESELQNSHRRRLAIPRNLCFVADTALTVSTQTILCGEGSVPAGAAYPPAWAFPAAATGLPVAGTGNPLDDGANLQIASCPGPAGLGLCQTVEGTKILPDGLFTPGTHVQYFFRREDDGEPGFGMVPDTNLVSPQPGEGSTDGHRWQEFSVLPDRWKSTAYVHPVLGTQGSGEACILYVDQNDRRGNEMVFIGVADSTGMTSIPKRGGHNGWSAVEGADVNDPTYFVRRHVGQAGTTFDKYDVKASESLNTGPGSIGSRESFRNPTNVQIDGKRSRQGPTQTMLNQYYKVLLTLTGDLNSSIYGPYNNKSQNDILVMQQFLRNGDPATPNRGFYAAGDGFVEGVPTAAVANFMTGILGVDLANPNYIFVSGNTERSVDLNATAALPIASSYVYGIRSACASTLDVLDRSSTLLSETAESSYYEDPNGLGPFPAGVYKLHSATNPWFALVDGFDIEALGSHKSINTRGRLLYYCAALQDAFGAVSACNLVGGPCFNGIDVADPAVAYLNYLRVAGNPMREATTTVRFGVARADRVRIVVYDVAGRLVRQIADRKFAPGEHSIVWDGVGDDGGKVARGVYFVRAHFAEQGQDFAEKLVMIR